MPLAIRLASRVDAPEVARIYVESWASGFGDLMPPPTLDDAQVDRWAGELDQSGPAQWWVAEIDGVIVGFVGITPSRDPVEGCLGELDTIAVDPAHWRAGVGSALMATAVDGLARAGYRRARRPATGSAAHSRFCAVVVGRPPALPTTTAQNRGTM